MKFKTLSNRLVAILLCTLLTVSSIFASEFISSAHITDAFWDGETLTAPTVGSGTAEDPFEISSAAELAYALNVFGKLDDGTSAHYKVTADIYFNDVSVADWLSDGVAKNPWFVGASKNGYYSLDGTETGAFVGSIDGNGHTVYGLWYPETTASFASGLVPVFSGGYIKNIGVDKAQIVTDLSSGNSERGAGAIAGITKDNAMVIDSCFSGADVTVKSNGSGASGIVGTVRNGEEEKLYISNCYSLAPNENIIMSGRTADKSNANYANGIIGNTWKCYFSVTNSYSLTKPYCLRNANLLSLDCVDSENNRASSAIITNFANVYSQSDVTKAWNNGFAAWGTYTDGETVYTVASTLTAEQMQGENALDNMKLGDKFVTTESYPVLKIFSADTADEGAWNGETVIPAVGDGSTETPYEISTAAELAYALNTFGKKTDGSAAYYKFTADIYLNDVSSEGWSSNANNVWFEGKDKNGYYTLDKAESGAFVGSIDGNGHIVYGLWYPETTASFASGLVPVFSGGYIKNIGVDKAQIVTDLSSGNSERGAGAIAGITKDNAMVIDSCFSGADVTVKSNGSGASGIVGTVRNGEEEKLYISNCYSLAPNENIIMSGRTADKSNANYANGIIGNTWKCYFSVTNSYSLTKPYCLRNANLLSLDCVDSENNRASSAIITNFANVYSQSDVTKAWNNGFAAWGTYTDGETVYTVASTLTAEQMQGENALDNMKLGDKFVTTESYPVLKIFYVGDGDDGDNGGDQEQPGDEDTGPVWNGKTAERFAKGTGTKDDPFVITKGSELALAVTGEMGREKYYSVEQDIYLNDVTDKYWYENETNHCWISDENIFNGHIDGNGHIIYGIWYSAATELKQTGLVPRMNGGSIRALGVRMSYINATHYAGGLVGATDSRNAISIDSCFADETVRVGYTAAVNGGAAGIVGYAYNKETPLVITNCYSKAVSTGADAVYRTNGIVGAAWVSDYSIRNSYSANTAPYAANSYRAVSSGFKPDGVTVVTPIEQIYSNVYSDGRQPGSWEYWSYISDPQTMRGEAAKSSMSGLDFKNVWQTVEGGTPKLKIFTSITGTDVDSSRDPEVYESGTGTKADPYVITNADQLEYLVRSENTKGKYYVLAGDIYVNNTQVANWTEKSPKKWLTTDDISIPFGGYIDGKGYCVYGLYVNDTPDPSTTKINSNGTALFPSVTTSAVIRNIHVRNSYISGIGYVGSIVGTVSGTSDYAEITGCSADTTVILKGQTVGGIAGGGNKRGFLMTYSYFTGKIALATGSADGDHRDNGLIGDLWGSDHIAAECYSVGYQNYRKSSYQPTLANAVYGTVPMSKTITLTPAQMKGTAAKKNMSELNWELWTIVNGGYPHIKVIPADHSYKFFDNGTKGEVWSGYIAESYAAGSGTKADPYIIETAEQMAKLVIDNNTLGNYYKLACDLYINDVSNRNWKNSAKTWMTSANYFRGHFDGNGNVVYGLYYDTSSAYAGLFTGLGPNGVIEKVGVSEAYILNSGDESSQAYSGGLVANIGSWQKAGEPIDESYERPIIRQCFVDDTVYIESHYAGGLVGGAGSGLLFENCYFTGELTGSSDSARLGTLIGNAWTSKNYSIAVNCYTSDVDGGYLISSNAAWTAQYENVYVDGSLTPSKIAGVAATEVTDAVKLNLIFMHGQNCKEYMSGFDFNRIWLPVKDGSPVLRCFDNAEKFSCKREPRKVEISFVTNGGSEVEPIYGYPRFTKIPELPTPSKYGYEFGGWYFYENCSLPVTIESFPDEDIHIYAKWINVGYTQDFEGDLDPEYDYNAGVELFRPGVSGYNPKYIHGGMKSIHALGDSELAPTWLIFYEDKLEIGKEYEMTFYVSTRDDETKGVIDLIHGQYPQYNTGFVGYETIVDLSSLEAGVWKEYKYTFTANAPYILFRSSVGADIYVDGVFVVPTGRDGELGKIIGFEPDSVLGEPISNNGILFVIIPIAGVIVLIGLAILVFAVIYRKRVKGGRSK